MTAANNHNKKQQLLLPTPTPIRLLLFPFLFFYYYLTTTTTAAAAAATTATPQEIRRGFSATPNPIKPPTSSFQSILSDPSGNFSLGFLLAAPSDKLDLVVLHLPSSLPVWRASSAHPARWAPSTSLSFNGTQLVLSDPAYGVVWSSSTDADGDHRLVLLNSSNLQIQKLSDHALVIWQSFDSPSDTLVQGQNFTSSSALFSADNRFSMRLGTNYLALYMDFAAGSGSAAKSSIMYWKHTALEAKAQIVEREGPIYARVNSLGFMSMYQNERALVDVIPFDSFNREIPGLRRLTLESDGNLRGYYWNAHVWVSDFLAFSDVCDLPAYCGPYGLCRRVKGECSCLDNRTGDGCFPEDSGDLCGGTGGGGDEFWVLRQRGVELAYKELVGSVKVGSFKECEGSCERNCSCWAAFYNNATGYCYRMDFPVQTLVAAGAEGKMGYFKVRGSGRGEGGKGKKGPFDGGVLVLVIAMAVFAGISAFGAYRVWRSRRRARGGVDGSLMVEGLSPVSYKVFKDSSSFRSIELSLSSFRR